MLQRPLPAGAGPLDDRPMLDALKKLLAGSRAATGPGQVAVPAATIPAGERVYAIGDVHGRLDLFDALVNAVEADDAISPRARTTIVLLGDLVDRGEDSAGVLAAARRLQSRRRVRILCGNHEEMFLKSLQDLEVFRFFLRPGCGGRATLASYGLAVQDMNRLDLDEAQAMARGHVPAADIAFIRSFEDAIAIGDYLFVHAGVAPDVPLELQRPADLRWIREPFLSHPDPFGAVVVHGHTIRDDVEDRGNRIGIDTGAYQSGRLTALVLEGTTRRYLQAVEGDDGVIRTAGHVPGGL